MSYIEFKNIQKSYNNTRIIEDFNLKIEKSSFVSLLGPSGCGKTTCLRMLAGLERNDSGSIVLDETILSDQQKGVFVSTEKRKLGMVFQSYAVWPHMNVFDNVAFPLKMQKCETSEIKKRVQEILQIVELDHLEKRMPNELSGGQQQRVALARGLVMNPKALLLDEPLSNLDTKLREKMRIDIKKIQKEMDLTMIYVTHDQLEAKTMSDLVVVMNQGKIVQSGTVDEIYKNPANQFVADFIR